LRRLSLKFPKKADLLIYDAANSQEIIDYIARGSIKTSILSSSYKQLVLYLRPYFLAKYIFLLFKYINLEKKLSSQIIFIYKCCIINQINPKVIITQADDSDFIQWLNKSNIITKKIKVFTIQNGIKQKWHKCFTNFMHFENYFSFGDYDKANFQSLGAKVKNFMPIGSLRLGIFNERHKSTLKNNKYDICLVSSYINLNNCKNHDYFRKFMHYSKLLDNYILEYSSSHNINLCIALKGKSSEEYNYYKSIFPNCNSIYKNNVPYNSYKLASQSNITLSFASSLILESIGARNKSCFIDTSNDDEYLKFDYPVRVQVSNYKDFSAYINNFLRINIDEYFNINKDLFTKYMNYNDEIPPQDIIRNTITAYLNGYN